MGCDFFFSGTVPATETQEKIIEFVRSHYSNADIFIQPDPGSTYRTLVEKGSSRIEKNHPFDYYGVIPFARTGILEHGQFIFDRANGGCLVRILKLPDSFDVQPHGRHDGEATAEVVISDGGYNRELGGYGFATLLNIIRLRWWPELDMSDDYGICRRVGILIWEYGLARRMANDQLDFDICMHLLAREHERRHPEIQNLPVTRKPYIRIIDPDAVKIRIDELGLSPRSLDCLRKMHIGTIGELLEHSELDLLSQRNFGGKNLAEVKDLLEDFGFHLKNE
jgi:hypothetical protein